MNRYLLSCLALLVIGFPLEVRAVGLVLSPSAGNSLTWNGNDGDFFTDNNPATVPNNLASTAQGSVAFADNNENFGNPHFISNLNDGLYGNVDSWISGGSAGNFAIIRLGAPTYLTSVAWGRDNGRNQANGDTAQNGGQLTDRVLGIYTLQYTKVAAPDASTPSGSWTTIGTLDYQSSIDAVTGGGFTAYFRHRYEVASDGSPIVGVTGVRIIAPSANGFEAIDEIEVYGVPEPASAMLFAFGAIGLFVMRKRQ